MRRIDIESDDERLRIEFPYDRSLVQTVKTLPERRYDPDTNDWYVPVQHIERVFETLLDHHFKITRELRSYCREHHRPVEEMLDDESEADGPASVPPGTWTVSELNLEANAILEEAFAESLWLVGELQSWDRARDWRHAFFELVERPAGDADPVAKIQAVMFQRHREPIEETLAEAPEEIRLRDGLTVRVRGEVELYPKKGSYQFVVREIDPTYTAGEIQRNRQVILETLEERGIRENNRELPWPTSPLRVGLITSYGSDAYNDFVDQLEASERGFQVTVHDAYVQGDRTEASMLEALEYFEQRADRFDAVVIVRGGGARSDLAYVDTEAIGEAVCRHPLKIVCGIGHQRDVCLLDHICESHKTPTAAAGALVERVEEFAERVEETIEEILEGAESNIRDSDQRLERLSLELGRRADRRLDDEQRRLANLRSALSHGARDRLEEDRRRVEGSARSLAQAARSRATRERQRVAYMARRLRPEPMEGRFEREQDRLTSLAERFERATEAALERRRTQLDGMQQRLRLLDPQSVLERGFAIVTNDDEVVRSSEQAPVGDQLDVRLADGEIVVVRTDDD